MGSTEAKQTFWCLTAVAAFVSCFLVGYSVDTYHPLEMAFVMDQNRGVPETGRLYNNGGGRIMTGLGRRFGFKYPRNARRLLFVNGQGAMSRLISGRLRDGLQVDIGLSVQYKLRQSQQEMEDLLYSYGDDWESFYVRYIRGAARNVLSQHGVFDMWERRGDIQAGLEREIGNVLRRRHADLVAVQLLSLDIPAAVQSAIESTTVMAQNQFEAFERKAATNVSEYTRFFEADRDADIQVINARKDGFVLLRQAEAAATSRQLEIDAQADSLVELQRGLNITDKDLLLALLYMDTLSATSSRVRFGVPQAQATVQS